MLMSIQSPERVLNILSQLDLDESGGRDGLGGPSGRLGLDGVGRGGRGGNSTTPSFSVRRRNHVLAGYGDRQVDGPGSSRATTATQSRRSCGSFLDQLGTDDLDELRTIAAALSNLIGIPTSPRGTYVTSEISQGELHWGIRRTLQLLSAKRPVALVFEDLHWAEPTLLELLAYIAADEVDAQIALICSARPDLAETSPGFLGDSGRRRTVALDTLDERQAAALLAELLGDNELTQTPFARALIANAGGNPLFLEETVRTLRDQGLVDLERWRHEDVDQLPVPTSVQGLISSRLDQLEPGEKRLAHNAAVAGAVFWAGAVRHLGAGDEGPAPDLAGLDTLERRDFVLHSAVSTVANEEEYAFKHILMRDVAYGQIPKGRRVQLHVRFSDWVTVLPGSADEFVEIVAWHLEQACRLSREVARSPIEPPLVQAADALANAARRAEAREGLKEAHRYYTRALDVLGDVQEELQLKLRVRRGDMAMMLGQRVGQEASRRQTPADLQENLPQFVARGVINVVAVLL